MRQRYMRKADAASVDRETLNADFWSVPGHRGDVIARSVTAAGPQTAQPPEGPAFAVEPNPVFAPFTPGNIVVYRIGAIGGGALSNAASAVFIDEYTASGVHVRTIALPTTDSGIHQTLTAAGATQQSEGLLTLSTDGHYLLLTGYDAAVGTPDVESTTAAAVNRVVGRIAADGTVDTSTALSDFASTGSPRGVASTNGTDIWVAGGADGLRYTTIGSTTSTQLTSVTNLRGVEIFDGQLYVSTIVSTLSSQFRLASVGIGLPTTPGQTMTNLNGVPSSGGNSPYQFFFADLTASVAGLDTLYVSDGVNGLLKYSLVAGTWTLNGTVGVNADDYVGLTGSVSGTTITLYATRLNGSSADQIVSLIDTGGYNAAFSITTPTVIATASANTGFRGIAFATTPGETQTVYFNPTSVIQYEGNSGTTVYTFTVTRGGGTTGQLDFSGTIALGTTDAADYVGGTAPTVFNGSILAGQASATITVTIQGDLAIESGESFTLTLTNVSNGAAGVAEVIGAKNVATGNVTDDDSPGTLSVNDVSIIEGNSGTSLLTFTVTRSGIAGAITADWTISAPGGAGNADAADFVAGAVFAGQLAFAHGETTKTISIGVQGDVAWEAHEVFTVTLSNATGGANIGDGTGTGVIGNDDRSNAGTVVVADASIVEGNAGTSILIMTLTRSGGTAAFDVNYATMDGGIWMRASATAGSDYVAASGTLSFAYGQNIATVELTINGDTVSELSEQFRLIFSGVTEGAMVPYSGYATITNDDAPTGITRIFEEDFTGLTAGGFAPSPTATQIDSDIWRVVGLSDIPTPAYGFTATTGDFARGTIDADDPTTAGVYSPLANQALVVQPTGAELEAGGFIEARIANSSGSTATGFDIAFDWVFRNSGDRASSLVFSYSTDGTNFVTVPAAAFTTPAALAAGATFTTQNEMLSLTGLSVAHEGFIYLRWTHAASSGGGERDEVGIDNLIVDATGGATQPIVSVSDVSVSELMGFITFTVTRLNAVAGAFWVDYYTSNGTALAGIDYVATNGALLFQDNQVSATVTVTLIRENISEFDETLFLNLYPMVFPGEPGSVADGQGVGTIVNDDGAPIQVSIDDVSIVEGNSGTSLLTFTVTRTGGTGAFDVNFNTQNGSAVEPGDYLANSGTLSFGIGQNSRTISITINGDTIPESHETFQVLLSGATNNAVIVDGTGVGTLIAGAGDNVYHVDNAGDVIAEPVGQGNDRVFASVSYALTAGAEVELMTTDWHLGTGAINLFGNEFANTIYGNDGDNRLDGGAGADTLVGRAGNDQFYVDNPGDRIFEAAGQGNDRLFASVSYTLTGGAEVELMTTDWHAGTAAIDLTGNALANIIHGNDGDNILNGGAGADALVGRAGNDWFVIDNAGDRVLEAAGQGNDRVFASVSYTLTAGAVVELITTDFHPGTAAIDLAGNELANSIFGNDGDNILDGKGGNDSLVGFAGADTFAFTTALGAGNVDRVFGFTNAVDKIALDDAIFGAGIGAPGAFHANAFYAGTAAHDADDRIVYNSATGQLFFDADGSGAGAAVQFATLSPGLALTAGDFAVI
ncbi:MAG TPA: Calx-beta domain-containing protein [Allosphingosinicella sp.]|nr:Calx-beta domain-containing protein [Allosphingosinicella sp.]